MMLVSKITPIRESEIGNTLQISPAHSHDAFESPYALKIPKYLYIYFPIHVKYMSNIHIINCSFIFSTSFLIRLLFAMLHGIVVLSLKKSGFSNIFLLQIKDFGAMLHLVADLFIYFFS